jgi:hypothetical protein
LMTDLPARKKKSFLKLSSLTMRANSSLPCKQR